MKRSNKFLMGGVFALLIGGGAYLNYLKAQPRERPSDLTLANIEALGLDTDETGIVVGKCGNSFLYKCEATCSKCGEQLSAGWPGPKLQAMGPCPNCGTWIL